MLNKDLNGETSNGLRPENSFLNFKIKKHFKDLLLNNTLPMIHVCDRTYTLPKEDGDKYNNVFKEYPFELDHFQKHAIEAIEKDKHVLLTAGTGSGKTLPAEYAVKKYCREKRKVIYTAPIKSLSNQKFHEFSKAYPDISFGILTGDIKFNPQADCLIMTTEILRNALFLQSSSSSSSSSSLSLSPDTADNSNENNTNENNTNENSSFNVDITDLKCVIFDEVHYINDQARGHVWEETIMKLPKHVQMVMLSATINKPEKFAEWIASVKGVDVWLTSTETRVVPLHHYTYFKCPSAKLKKINEKSRFGDKNASNVLPLIEEIDGKLVDLKMQGGTFNNNSILNLHKIFSYFFKENVRINNKYTLNEVCNYLHINSMLPAICFVFSRKNVIEFAKYIEHSLFTGKESHFPNLIENECKQILMKLPNYREYIELAEYKSLTALLKKGVAVHHSGILPVLREMVEMLFSKGYVKMLFATETFAIGVNMPTKTALFTGLSKFDGNNFRNLLPHEYTQMAGRAGRRGMDKVGHVIHLVSAFELPSLEEYREVLNGVPQTFVSKFEIDFSLILREIKNVTTITGSSNCGEHEIHSTIKSFIEKSMIGEELRDEFISIQKRVENSEKYVESLEIALLSLVEDEDILLTYKNLLSKLEFSKNKQRKRLEEEIKSMETSNPTLKEYYKTLDLLEEAQKELEYDKNELNNATFYVDDRIESVINFFSDNGFIELCNNKVLKLTQKGTIASQIQEVNCLAFSEIIAGNYLRDLNVIELVSVLSSFVSLRVPEEQRVYNCNVSNERICRVMDALKTTMDIYYDSHLNIIGYVDDAQYTLVYDIQECMIEWCESKSEEESKAIINGLTSKEIFLGEFVKCILKINNIAHELGDICDSMGADYVDLKHKLSQIPELTLKYVATNQSLYI